MTILIPHGSSPTGFGIRQRSNGNLRPLSKCCGRSMQEGKLSSGEPSQAVCRTCGKDYNDDANDLGCSLGNDVSPTSQYLESWIRRVTGYSDAIVSVV